MRITVVFLLILLSCKSFAQQPANSRAELERRRQSILQSIRDSQEQLAETKKNKNATMSQLRALQAKLDARMRLIGNINQEMQALESNIQNSSRTVGTLNNNLSVLKMRYAQSVRYAYANRSSSNMLAFLFSAKSYNDAMRRMKYLRRYRNYRQQQADAIRTTQGRIEEQIDVLNNQKLAKNLLLTAEEQQKKQLLQETNETNSVVKELKGKEAELASEIAKAQKAAKQVDRAVAAIIAREIEEQRRKAMEEARRQEIARRKAAEDEAARKKAEDAKKLAAGRSYGGMAVAPGMNGSKNGPLPEDSRPVASTVTTGTPERPSDNTGASVKNNQNRPRNSVGSGAVDLMMTPEAQALSNSFAANRGRLPWPVERGTITGRFGKYQHPVFKGVEMENYGILIQTTPGAPVRAVYEGTVGSIFSIGGNLSNILVIHGGYYTLYKNLAGVSVTKGQHVSTKQQIGTVGNNEDGLPTLDFQIWKTVGSNGTKLDPAGWIAR
jgi:septal ring factor EnvC (AmiA/AmiB activator)